MSDVEPWRLSYDDQPDADDFVDGLRLSTDCVTRRIIEPLDKERYHEFPEPLGRRGHGFERIMQEWLREQHGVGSVREVVVPWEYGETHLDLLVDESGAEKLWGCTHGGQVLVELKVNKDAGVKTENVRQAQRQRFVIERAVAAGRTMRCKVKTDDGGWEWQTLAPAAMANLEYRVMVIDPFTWNIPDPRGVRITITDDRRLELDAEWATMQEVMSRKDLRYDIEWPERMPECKCGKCFTPPLEELPEALHENAAAYDEARSERKFAEEVLDYHKGVLRDGVLALRRGAPELLDKRGSWVGGGWKVTLSKSGTVLVTKSDAKASPQL